MLCESATIRIMSSKVSLVTMPVYFVKSTNRCRSTVHKCFVCTQVETDEYGFALEPLLPGQLMAHHYINFKTMKDICMISGHAGLPDLLMAIARSQELSGIKLRRSEKKPLNAINKGSSSTADKVHAVRFYVPDPKKSQKAKERISTSAEKIFVMVRPQAVMLIDMRSCFWTGSHGCAAGCGLYPLYEELPKQHVQRSLHVLHTHGRVGEAELPHMPGKFPNVVACSVID